MAALIDSTAPTDELAESVLLDRVFSEPALLDQVDLGPLLISWEHRVCWESMAHVGARTPAAFFVAWRRDLCARECTPDQKHEYWTDSCRAFRLWRGISLIHETLPGFVPLWREYAWQGGLCNVGPDWCSTTYRHPPHKLPTDYWLRRLRRVHQARQLLHTIALDAEPVFDDPPEQPTQAVAAAVIDV